MVFHLSPGSWNLTVEMKKDYCIVIFLLEVSQTAAEMLQLATVTGI